MSARRYLAPAGLALCLLVSAVMLALKPIPHAHRYGQALKLSVELTAFWFLYKVKPGWTLKRGVLIFACLAGLGLGIGEISVINPRSEIVQVYDSVFSTIRDGGNPYTTGTIFHYAEFDEDRLRELQLPAAGNLPLPPGLQDARGVEQHGHDRGLHRPAPPRLRDFLLTFPEVKRRYLVPFFPLFLFTEIIVNSAMTFLVTALILLVVKKDQAEPRPATGSSSPLCSGPG